MEKCIELPNSHILGGTAFAIFGGPEIFGGSLGTNDAAPPNISLPL